MPYTPQRATTESPIADLGDRTYGGGVAAAEHGTPRASGDPVYRITGVGRGLAEDQATRTRRYLISMGIRTVCFVTAVVASGWLRWILIAAAVLLPYLSVVFANAGRERTGSAPTEVFLRPDRQQIGLGNLGPDSGVDSGSDSGLGNHPDVEP